MKMYCDMPGCTKPAHSKGRCDAHRTAERRRAKRLAQQRSQPPPAVVAAAGAMRDAWNNEVRLLRAEGDPAWVELHPSAWVELAEIALRAAYGLRVAS